MGATTGVIYCKAVFACGCFWSKEYFFAKQLGVVSTRVGFTGGNTEQPGYREVCGKQTGHAEAVEVTFDSEQTSFETLARYFFEIHDPTVDRTGKGGQYRSAIFYQDQKQHGTALLLVGELQKLGYEVATRLEPAAPFWEAEERHQKYCETHCRQPQPNRVRRFELPAA